jgi:hypothetical protein
MLKYSFITVSPRPVIAVVSSACEYGLDTKAVSTRVLKWTYGVRISPEWVSVNNIKKVRIQLINFIFVNTSNLVIHYLVKRAKVESINFV